MTASLAHLHIDKERRCVRGLSSDDHLPVDIVAMALHVREAKARAWLVAENLLDTDRKGQETALWGAVINRLRRKSAEAGPRRPRRGAGWVYFVQATPNTPIKIGYATNPDDRLASLQTGSPYRLRILLAVPGNRKHEKMLHKHFRASRAVGEWFAETDELRSMIAGWGARGKVWKSSAPDDDAEIAALLDSALGVPRALLSGRAT